jgi:hypothetical protein
MDTRDWEQEIENVVEQSAFGETQRANSVYRSEHDNQAQNFKCEIVGAGHNEILGVTMKTGNGRRCEPISQRAKIPSF